MAIVILSAGPLTDSRLRTVDAGRLTACAFLALFFITGGSFALGYVSARPAHTPEAPDNSASRIDLDQPEARALIDRVGTLSSRITLLESEAATLAKRLGVARQPAANAVGTSRREAPRATPGVPTTHLTEPLPSGGPFIPLPAHAMQRAVGRDRWPDFGTGLSRLEAEMPRLEAVLARLADIAVEQSLARMALPSRLPIRQGPTSSGFGIRRDPFTGRLARHEGLDFPASVGTPILASAGGRVVTAGNYGPYGRAVVIDHGNGLCTLYGHASKVFVRPGELVMPNQAIAAVGSTGRSTGAHLHFEVIRNGVRVEPRNYLVPTDSPIEPP